MLQKKQYIWEETYICFVYVYTCYTCTHVHVHVSTSTQIMLNTHTTYNVYLYSPREVQPKRGNKTGLVTISTPANLAFSNWQVMWEM